MTVQKFRTFEQFFLANFIVCSIIYIKDECEMIYMSFVKQHDKRSGNTYVYESFGVIDKETGLTKFKRRLIGKIDKKTGEIIPTSGSRRKAMERKELGIDNVDYQKLYEKALKRIEAQNDVIVLLKKEIQQLRG